MDQDLQRVELSYSDEYESSEQPPADIVVFNELRSCADLYRLENTGQLDIKPFFQRDQVWSDADQTRFIDSLVKQLPIPSLCLGYDYQARKWIVIDGLQRLSALIRFLNPKSPWQLSILKDIDPTLAGAKVSDIHEPNSALYAHYERVQNVTLPITVLRCNFEQFGHMEYLFKIFHRLNSGGMRLSNQEIRNCIYAGSFNNLIVLLDKDHHWKGFKTHIVGKKDRFRSVELILRMFAFLNKRNDYKGNLSKFLNSYMLDNRFLSDDKCTEHQALFQRVSTVLSERIIPLMQEKKIGFAQTEALLVSLAENIDSLEGMQKRSIASRFNKFLAIPLLSSDGLRNDISNRDNVKNRITQAIQAFS